jgi:WD40 repeat protein
MAYGNMEHGVAVIRIADRDIVDYVSDIQCSDVTSLKLSHDGKRVLVSCAPDELQLFALEPHLHVVRKYVGHVQSRFLIRSSFGATKDRFVLSGSEDGHVYVWQSNAATPLEVLSGHRDTVNAVAWNPVSSRKLFASCSDDTQM